MEENKNTPENETHNESHSEIQLRGGGLATLDSFLPKTLFVIPIRTAPVFPGMIAPLSLSKAKLLEIAEQSLATHGMVGLILIDESDEAEKKISSKPGRLHKVGTVVRILRRLNTQEGGMTVLVQSLKRFKVLNTVREEPYTVVQVEYLEDSENKGMEIEAITRAVISQVKELSESNPFFTEEMKLAMVNTNGPGSLADLVAFALALSREDAQSILETVSVKQRLEKLLIHLKHEQQVADLQKKINEDVNQKIQKMQREFFLKEQMRTIRKELGSEKDGKSEEDKYRDKIESLKLSAEAKKIALEELHKLETTPESSPEHNIIRNYLDWMLSLPWGIETIDNLDLKHARKVLHEDHFGIPKVKDRILEYLAVRKLKPDSRGSVLCLVGPPGVGKTSLGKSIARAMGRNFFRFSLGGMRDEAEIKGHRRTYIGAMPGKLLNALKRSGSSNPVLLLDEVDKLGMSYQGDPASALLEVLDPEQNSNFLDHYLDVPFDLSGVLFVLTANSTDSIPAALLDRMEVIELSGYTLEEKQEIAKKYVIPKEAEKHGVEPLRVEIPDSVLMAIMLKYCREPGVRSLQQTLATVFRKIAAKIAEKPGHSKITLREKDLYDYLGPEKFENEAIRRVQDPGVVTGLAWTPMGGQILFIEASEVPRRTDSRRRGGVAASQKESPDTSFGNFKITGQLGEVMSESASIAYSYVKKKTRGSKVARQFFDENEIHVHVPAGAVPKDGPSAGVTMATALFSLVTGKKVNPNLAMTGELSLVGKVLPVGGIREKVLAAKRAGLETVILPKQNKKDLKEIPDKNIRGMKFVFADTVEDVFKAAFQK